VTLTRLIPERHHALAKEVVTFGTVGAINTGVGQLIFAGLLRLALGPSLSLVISTAIATVLSYLLNRHVTYRHRPRTSVRRELPLFAAFNTVALGIQLALLNLSRYAFNIPDSDHFALNVVRFCGAGVGTLFLLLTYRTFVFKKAKPETAVDEALTEAVEVSSMVLVQRATDFAELTTPLEAELADREPEDEPATTSAK
jgi:putative flippase GtrA